MCVPFKILFKTRRSPTAAARKSLVHFAPTGTLTLHPVKRHFRQHMSHVTGGLQYLASTKGVRITAKTVTIKSATKIALLDRPATALHLRIFLCVTFQELLQRRTLGLHTWGRLLRRLNRHMVRQKKIAEGRRKPCCVCVLLGLKK